MAAHIRKVCEFMVIVKSCTMRQHGPVAANLVLSLLLLMAAHIRKVWEFMVIVKSCTMRQHGPVAANVVLSLL